MNIRDSKKEGVRVKKGSIVPSMEKVVNDNSNDNFTPSEYQTLDILLRHNTLLEVSRYTGRDKSNVYRTLSNLVKRGFVERLDKQYILSGTGHYALKKKSCHGLDGVQTMTTPSIQYKQPVRGHRITFNILLWSIPDGWKKWINTCCGLNLPESSQYFPHDLKRITIKHNLNTKWNNYSPCDISLSNGFSFRVHTKGVLVHIPAVIADTSNEAAQIAFRRLTAILPKLERWLKLNPTALYKEGRLNIKLVTAEYALFKHEFARWWVHTSKGREKFLVEGDDGSLRLLIDMSPPFRFEVESVHPVKSEADCGTVQEYFKPIIEGQALRPDVVKDRIKDLDSNFEDTRALINNDLNPVLSEFSVQMAAHVGTAKGLNAGASAMDKASLQMGVMASAVTDLVREMREEREESRQPKSSRLRRLLGWSG